MLQQELLILEEVVEDLKEIQLQYHGGSGGSGIVIVRAPGPAGPGYLHRPGTNTVTTLPAPAGGCKVATFTVSGTLTVS
jgi:hypothetical protein